MPNIRKLNRLLIQKQDHQTIKGNIKKHKYFLQDFVLLWFHLSTERMDCIYRCRGNVQTVSYRCAGGVHTVSDRCTSSVQNRRETRGGSKPRKSRALRSPAEFLEELVVGLLARLHGPHQAVRLLGPHDVAHLVLAQVHGHHPTEDSPEKNNNNTTNIWFLLRSMATTQRKIALQTTTTTRLTSGSCSGPWPPPNGR